MKRISAKPMAWLPLLVPMALPIYLATANFAGKNYIQATVLTIFTIIVLGYNSSATVFVDENSISFYRFFIRRWRVSIDKADVSIGRGGELPLLPALVLREEGVRKGVLILGLFHRSDMLYLIRLLGVVDPVAFMERKMP